MHSSISHIINQFASDQDVQPNSRDLYKRNVWTFVKWVQATGREMEKLQKSDVIEYKQGLFKRKLSPSTIDSYITSIRKFYQWLDDKDLYENIMLGVKNPWKYKGYRKIPLTVEQVNTLLNSIDRTTIRGKRDYAMINLMLRTALRTIEVIRLTVEDMVMEGGIIMLYVLRKGSQGNKTKIQLTHKAFDPINDYLVDRKNLKDDQPLFTGLSYNNRNGQMGQKSLSAIIRQRLQDAGIHDSRITAHSMRHTAAVNALKAGASLHDLQLFMGHTDPSTTQIYVRILEEEKRLANGPGKLLDNVY